MDRGSKGPGKRQDAFAVTTNPDNTSGLFPGHIMCHVTLDLFFTTGSGGPRMVAGFQRPLGSKNKKGELNDIFLNCTFKVINLI